MSVYVDKCERRDPRGIQNKHGEWLCHMLADSAEELRAAAKALGVKLPRKGACLLGPCQRLRAVELGAKEVTSLFLLKKMLGGF